MKEQKTSNMYSFKTTTGLCNEKPLNVVQLVINSKFQNKTSEEKRLAVLEKIRTEPKAVDLKLLFYIASCESMTEDSTLIPSPKDYLGSKPHKETLQEINGCIPNVDLLRVYLETPNLNKISDDTLSVLHWLLIALNEPRFVILDKEEEWPVLDVDEDLKQEGKSNLGTQMSATMMIEIVDNLKTIVKRQNHRAIYYLISDPSYTRIRYILIWIHAAPAARPRLCQQLECKVDLAFVSCLIIVGTLFLPKKLPLLLQKGLAAVSNVMIRHK